MSTLPIMSFRRVIAKVESEPEGDCSSSRDVFPDYEAEWVALWFFLLFKSLRRQMDQLHITILRHPNLPLMARWTYLDRYWAISATMDCMRDAMFTIGPSPEFSKYTNPPPYSAKEAYKTIEQLIWNFRTTLKGLLELDGDLFHRTHHIVGSLNFQDGLALRSQHSAKFWRTLVAMCWHWEPLRELVSHCTPTAWIDTLGVQFEIHMPTQVLVSQPIPSEETCFIFWQELTDFTDFSETDLIKSLDRRPLRPDVEGLTKSDPHMVMKTTCCRKWMHTNCMLRSFKGWCWQFRCPHCQHLVARVVKRELFVKNFKLHFIQLYKMWNLIVFSSDKAPSLGTRLRP